MTLSHTSRVRTACRLWAAFATSNILVFHLCFSLVIEALRTTIMLHWKWVEIRCQPNIQSCLLEGTGVANWPPFFCLFRNLMQESAWISTAKVEKISVFLDVKLIRWQVGNIPISILFSTKFPYLENLVLKQTQRVLPAIRVLSTWLTLTPSQSSFAVLLYALIADYFLSLTLW